MNKVLIWIGCMALSSIVYANDGHDMNHATEKHVQHEHMSHSDVKPTSTHSMFLKKTEVDGYTVTFHVMPATQDMRHGGSHNLMVKVEKGGKEVPDVIINSKVFFPNKTTASKMLMKMNGWFMNGYDMGEGKHGIMILFKTSDGKKHKASVYYPEES